MKFLVGGMPMPCCYPRSVNPRRHSWLRQALLPRKAAFKAHSEPLIQHSGTLLRGRGGQNACHISYGGLSLTEVFVPYNDAGIVMGVH